MADLYFNVFANWQEVEHLKNECSRLEAQLRATNAQTDPKYQKALEDQLKSTRQKMDEMVVAASHAATVLGKDYTRKIEDAMATNKRLRQSIDVTKRQYVEMANMRGALYGKRKGLSANSSEYKTITNDINSLTQSMGELMTRRTELDKQYAHSKTVLNGLNEQRALYASGLQSSKVAAGDASVAIDKVSKSSARTTAAMGDLGVTAGQKLPSAFGLFNNSVGMLNENLVTLGAGLLGGFGFAQFMNTIIHTRGQFQQTEMAFETMLGSAEKASALTNQLIDTAAKTPFDFGQVTGAAKQLLAYGTAANEVNDILKRLGDISAGVGSSMGELAYLYGTTMTQGRMYTMDLRQFMGRGIPMAEALAKVMDTTTAKVGKLVTDGKVGAEQVKAAIIEMTKEGSKFGGMMERQSASFTGRLSNIEDAISQMFNELGKKLEPTIGKGLELTGAMVENWETIGKYILTACTALGTYKAGLLATAAIRNVQEKSALTATNTEFANQIKELERMKRDAQSTFASMRGGKDAYKEETMAGINESLMDTTQDDTMLKARLEIARQNGIINEELEKEILNKRQLIELATEETRLAQLNVERQTRANLDEELTAATDKWSAAQNELDDAKAAKEATEAAIAKSEALVQQKQAKLDNASATEKLSLATEIQAEYDRQESLAQQLSSDELRVNTAQQNLDAAATERNTIQTKLNTTNKNINTLSTKGNTLAATSNAGAVNSMTLAERINSVTTKAASVAHTIFSAAVMEATTALNAMKAALLSNPITAIATVAMTAVTAFSMFGDEVDEVTKISEKFGEAEDKAVTKVGGLIAILSNLSSTTGAAKQAKKELVELYNEYGIKADAEKDSVETLISKHEQLIEAIKSESAARIEANAVQTEIDNYAELVENAWKDFGEGIDSTKKNSVIASIKMQISQEDIQAINDVRISLEEAKAAGDAVAAANWAEIYQKQLEVLEARVQKTGDKMNLAAGDTNALRDKVKTLVETITDGDRAMRQNISNINEAAEGYVNWNNKVVQNNNTLKVAKMKVEDVRAETDKLIKEFNTTCHMNLKVHYDGSEIPQWIKNMSDADLAKFIGTRNTMMNQANKYKKTHEKGSLSFKVGGNKKTAEQVGIELAMATQIRGERDAARKKKEQEDANKKDKKKTNSFDPEKAKSDVEKAKEKIKEINKKAQEDIDKAFIDNMEDGKDKELAKMEQTNKEKLAAIEKQKKQMIDAWVSLAKAEYFQKNKKTKGFNEAETRSKIEKNFDTDPKYKEQQGIIDDLTYAENKRYGKELFEYEKKAIDDYYSFMKQYGTQREKQVAVEKEYDEKISKAQTEGERLTLTAQKNAEMEKLKIEGIKEDIDWRSIFSDFTVMFEGELKSTLANLKEYTKTSEYKQSGAENQKAVAEAIDKLNGMVGGDKGTLDFKKLNKEMSDLGTKVKRLKDLEGIHATAVDEAVYAQNEYAKALKKGDKKEIESAKIKMDSANLVARNTGQATENLKTDIETSSSELKTSFEDTVNGLGDLASGLSGLKSGSLTGAYQGLQKFASGLESFDATKEIGGKLSKALGGKGFIADIVAGILSILDLLKDGIGTIVAGLIDTILGAINGIIENILSLKFIEQIGGSLIKGVGSILDTITGYIGNALTFGLASHNGITSWFTNGNEKEVQEITDRLTKSNERLREAIDKLTDNISEVYGVRAMEEAEAARKANEEMIENQKQILIAQMEYHSAHHSNAAYWADGDGTKLNDDINAAIADYDRKNGTISKKVSVWKDLATQSPEVLDYIRTNYRTLWEQIVDVGKYDKSEYWDALADLAGSAKEIEDALLEKLTQTSFDEMQNSFFDALMNMETDAEDWANDLSKIMAEALIKNNIFDQDFQEKMRDWVQRYKAAMENFNNGDINQKQLEDELAALREEQTNMLANAKEEAQIYMDAVGYDPNTTEEQSATAQGASSITYDQANNLEGIATAQQITSEQTKNEITMLNAKVDTLMPVWTDTRNIVADSRDILAGMAMDVADIKDNVADSLVPTLKAMRDDLTKIRKKVDMN